MKPTEFKESFFVELTALVETYKVLYVTSDGNMFRHKPDAQIRCHDLFERTKGKKSMYWAKITPENCPCDNEEFTKLMERYVDDEVKEAEKPTVDIDKAKEILEAKKAAKKSSKTVK